MPSITDLMEKNPGDQNLVQQLQDVFSQLLRYFEITQGHYRMKQQRVQHIWLLGFTVQ